jgi:hypothetical protein
MLKRIILTFVISVSCFRSWKATPYCKRRRLFPLLFIFIFHFHFHFHVTHLATILSYRHPINRYLSFRVLSTRCWSSPFVVASSVSFTNLFLYLLICICGVAASQPRHASSVLLVDSVPFSRQFIHPDTTVCLNHVPSYVQASQHITYKPARPKIFI